MIVLFTDGITEAEDEQGTLYGIDLLVESATKVHGLSATAAASAIVADLKAHIGTQKVHDDITLVVVKHR